MKTLLFRELGRQELTNAFVQFADLTAQTASFGLKAPVLPAKEAEDATKDQDGHPEEAREDGQGGVDFLKLNDHI
jgi:hypothetical protein